MKVRALLQMILTMSLSSIGALYLTYLAWRLARNKMLRDRMDSRENSDDEDNGTRRESRKHRQDSTLLDTNIIWTVVRPVLTQVMASALQDKTTQHSFRNLCLAVLVDEQMKSQFREVVTDVWRSQQVQESMSGAICELASSEKIAASLALLLKNACSNDQAKAGLSKVLSATLLTLSQENREMSRRILSESLTVQPASCPPAADVDAEKVLHHSSVADVDDEPQIAEKS